MRVHHVFANRSNIGDWLSARGIQQLLHDVDPEIEFVEHLCDEPFVTTTLDALSAAPADEPLVIGGGGLFMDYFEAFWRGFERLAKDRRFAIWGVGVVDLKQEPSLPDLGIVRRLVGSSAITVVRDDLTRGVVGAPLRPAVPCPSLAGVPRADTPGWGVLHVNNYTTVGPAAYDAMRAIGQDYAASTGRPYRETNNRIEPDRRDLLDEQLDRYRRSDIVVSSALHGCVIAVAMGRPVLAVSGDRKIESFMAAVGLADWVLDQNDVTRVDPVLRTLDQQQPASERVASAIDANRAVARELVAALRPASAART